MRLAEIFSTHGTDKSGHGYADLYECLLSHRRQQINCVLEVGIGTLVPGAPSTMLGYGGPNYQQGASLRAWREYFPNAWIYGFDTQLDTMTAGVDRITTIQCDSTDSNSVYQAMYQAMGAVQKPFDLIIDDGSHVAQDQFKTLRNLFPYLNTQGLYIVEDVLDLRILDALRSIVSGAPLFYSVPRDVAIVAIAKL